MARNSKPRGASKPSGGRQIPGWVWMFNGVVIGLFIAFLVYLADLRLNPPAPGSNDTPTAPEAATREDDSKPRFDFYAVLPKMEVIVPKGEDDGGPERQSTDDSLAHRHDESYLLQAGSFRTAGDADRRRAELILQGFDVRVQAVELGSGDVWHRVMIGPFTNANTMHRAQDKLASAGVETLPIKVRGE